MFRTQDILINVAIIILSIIVSYLVYRYLDYDLIDINKLVKNDIEKFEQQFNPDIFQEGSSAHNSLKQYTANIQGALKYFLDKDITKKILERQ